MATNYNTEAEAEADLITVAAELALKEAAPTDDSVGWPTVNGRRIIGIGTDDVVVLGQKATPSFIDDTFDPTSLKAQSAVSIAGAFTPDYSTTVAVAGGYTEGVSKVIYAGRIWTAATAAEKGSEVDLTNFPGAGATDGDPDTGDWIDTPRPDHYLEWSVATSTWFVADDPVKGFSTRNGVTYKLVKDGGAARRLPDVANVTARNVYRDDPATKYGDYVFVQSNSTYYAFDGEGGVISSANSTTLPLLVPEKPTIDPADKAGSWRPVTKNQLTWFEMITSSNTVTNPETGEITAALDSLGANFLANTLVIAVTDDLGNGATIHAIQTPSRELKTLAEWKVEFDNGLSGYTSTADALSTSGDSWKHYTLAPYIDATNAMYKATLDTQYIDLAIGWIEAAIATAAVDAGQYTDGYQGWPMVTAATGTVGDEFPLHDSYLWRYAVQTIDLIKSTPTLINNAAYAAKYTALMTFTEQHIWAKWYSRSANQADLYRSRTHMGAHWAAIALVLRKHSTDTTIAAQATTFNNNYDYAGFPAGTAFPGANLTAQFYSNGELFYFKWLEDPTFANDVSEVSYANNVVSYMMFSQELRDYWRRGNLESMMSIVYEVIANNPLTIDGGTPAGGSGNLSDGFVKLGRLDTEVQYALQQYTGGGTDSAQFRANMALNMASLV